MAIAENRSRRAKGGGTGRLGVGTLAAMVLTGCVVNASGMSAKAPRDGGPVKPWVQVSLDAIGFPGVSDTFLQIGASMLTVHILNDTHLLVTFSTRDLVPRLAGDPKTDDDRMVAAEIVDLPSGKVEAQTRWHMHDHGRYLWKLGEGRFLVRIGNMLSIMTPLANLGTSDPFQRVTFPGQHYRPSAVMVSPDGELLTLESVVSYVNPDGRAEVLLGDVGADQPVTRTVVEFFRLSGGQDGAASAKGEENALQVMAAGTLVSPQPVMLPVDADGYLWTDETGRNIWSVGFDTDGRKTIDVGKLHSSCVPRLQMVSREEFVAFTCQGTDSSVKMASYGLDGHETWEEGMGDLGTPVFAFAPAAARFAISRSAAAVPGLAVGSGMATGTPARQEVRVYQNASGDLLLKVECSPIFKSAENFDLSADGTVAAVVRNGAIAVYKLPPPGKQDLEDMAEVAKFAPPPGAGMVSLGRLVEPAGATKGDSGEMAKGDAGRPVVGAPGQPGTAAGQAAAGSGPVAGQAAVQAPVAPGALRSAGTGVVAVVAQPSPAARKPPTLLKPGEKPEFGGSNQAQQGPN